MFLDESSPLPLANQRRLFERDEHRSHPGNILCLFVGFWIEVAESGHPLPFGSWAAAIALSQEGLLRCSVGGWETREELE